MRTHRTCLTTIRFKRLWLHPAVALMCFAWASASHAQTTLDDPLHGMCNAPTPVCNDNNTVTPTGTNTPSYGFTVSPKSQTGDYLVVTLIPDNLPGANSESFSIFESSTAITSHLFSTVPFTGGFLGDYLSTILVGGSSPSNPLSAFLPTTTASLDPGATGYYVYVADLGNFKLLGPGASTATPSLFDCQGPSAASCSAKFALPGGSSIVAFLGTGSYWIATASSGQLSINTPTPSPTPEPASMLLFGTGLFAIGGILRRRKTHS